MKCKCELDFCFGNDLLDVTFSRYNIFTKYQNVTLKLANLLTPYLMKTFFHFKHDIFKVQHWRQPKLHIW